MLFICRFLYEQKSDAYKYYRYKVMVLSGKSFGKNNLLLFNTSAVNNILVCYTAKTIVWKFIM